MALASLLLAPTSAPAAEDPAAAFSTSLKPLFTKHCIKCHGGEKTKGKVNLKEITTAPQLRSKPKLLKEMIEAIDAYDMPPEDEPELAESERSTLLASLESALREAVAEDAGAKQIRIRRLNRFQYNNTLRDLFQLKRNVFALPEKLMTRHSNYLDPGVSQMPAKVEVACHSLSPAPGLRGVKSFPKDLRAAHGYDNQANQLTVSPLLLDSFLRLSLSIIESPDFNENTVGIWNDFFRDPGSGDLRAEIRRRLQPFLFLAFRSAIEPETLDRYTDYTFAKVQQGLSFTDAMKKVASATLSSPRFLLRYGSTTTGRDLFVVASNLAFFLWSSGPDLALLKLAESGELATLDTFRQTIDRMMADPRIERFLDTFPSQWMQLENLLGATPDPKLAHLFNIDKNSPASVQMILEPLLLFDTMFLENRPVIELVAPKFAYQSEFLRTWYTSDLKPPQVDAKSIVARNKSNDQQRANLQAIIKSSQSEIDALLKPVKTRLLQARQKGGQKPVNLNPVAAWEFNNDLRDSVGSLHLKAHGKIQHRDGMVVLNNAYLQSSPLPFDLKARTLEVWCLVHNIDQRGGGLMGVQGPGDFFDTIVLGERQPRHWISGSNRFARTQDFPESTPETKPDQRIHLAMVYQEDGAVTLYRNGKPYGKPFRTGVATFPKGHSSIIFGLRHLPPGGNKHLHVSLARARFYNRALSAEEVAGSAGGTYLSETELVGALTPEQRSRRDALSRKVEESRTAHDNVPVNTDPRRAQQDAQRIFEDDIRSKLRSRTFERLPATDPRYGGVITNAAMLSMTSGPSRTHPIARGAWVIEVIFNDPPPPPPNNVPPLKEDAAVRDLTIREKFAEHRENPDCAGCHSRLDPLGFALENYDIIGRWRDKYPNGRNVDASGTLMKKHPFDGAIRFKQSITQEDRRFARAFTAHLLRYAISKELSPADFLTVGSIIEKTTGENFKLKSLMREIILSESFLGGD
jgi:mono/diheme cytochrome c family protein|tara:strand:+ start:10713 stop:13631 length:2919 start_codon:yes stop_codon:yes gene_type:complete